MRALSISEWLGIPGKRAYLLNHQTQRGRGSCEKRTEPLRAPSSRADQLALNSYPRNSIEGNPYRRAFLSGCQGNQKDQQRVLRDSDPEADSHVFRQLAEGTEVLRNRFMTSGVDGRRTNRQPEGSDGRFHGVLSESI